MNGKVKITVSNSNFDFVLTFDRNVSFIRGDSGTGKSFVYSVIEDAVGGVGGANISVTPSVRVIPLPHRTMLGSAYNWYDIIHAEHNVVFIIDEESDCFSGKPVNFSTAIKGTDNYYVLINRKNMYDMPYSVEAIYELHNEVSPYTSKVIITNKGMYSNCSKAFSPDVVVTEDSGSGNFFFREALGAAETPGSKTRMRKKLSSLLKTGRSVLAVVDGAAFGPEITDVAQLIDNASSHAAIYMPESFEWLALNSIEFDTDAGIQLILIDYLDIIDYAKYFSIEQYMTAIFKRVCNERGYTYNKSAGSLPNFVLTPENIDRLLSMVPGVTFTNKE